MDSKRVEEDYKALVASNTWSAVYQSITQRCHSYRYTCVEAKKSENKSLNRYRDVSPYDHSRIVLRREGFDYINANLVKVERANRQYILTQGPLVTTSSHFWLMIWEQNCPAVIMLNRVYENLEVKCHWYWPPKEQKILKQIPYTDVNMTVSRVSELDCNYYTIRKLRVTNHDTEESRFIWQFHYTNWPDFGVPESPHAFLVFLEHVKEYGALDGREGPAVVHCSAGIGRSGTFCLVDSVLVLVQNEGQANVDVQEVLLEMRRYRMGLVQTSEQFRFSYKAIIEGIKRMDPDYEPNSDVVPEPEQVVPRQEEEAPPPPPPRGESLGQPPARPLPAIPASASMGLGIPPGNAPEDLETHLYLRRRARALTIAASGTNLASQEADGMPTLAALAATSAGIEPRTVPASSTLPALSLMAAQIVINYPLDAFGNPLSVDNQMERFEDPLMATLQEQPVTPAISDSLPSMSHEDPPLHSSSEDNYISSEDMVTYNTSGEFENADMMAIDPPANQGDQSLNIIELNSSIDSDASDLPPTPPPRPRHVIRSRSETRALPASASMGLGILPGNAPEDLEMHLYLRRRARALTIAASGTNLASQEADGMPTLAALAATSAGIEPRTVPASSTLPALSLMAAQIVINYPLDAFGNPLSVDNQMERFEDPLMATLQEQPVTPAISDSLPSMSHEDPPLHSSSEDNYISSEDMVTYETSGKYADMISIDPPANQDDQSLNIIELSSDEDMPPTPPPRPEDTDPGSPAGSSYEDIDEDQDIAESLDGAEAEVGGGERSGVRRRRNDALAERVADMKKRSREADRWNTVKRSFLKPLAISVSVGLLAVAGVLIYSYTHRH